MWGHSKKATICKQEEILHQKPNTVGPWFWTSSPQNCGKINFYYVSRAVCSGSPGLLIQVILICGPELKVWALKSAQRRGKNNTRIGWLRAIQRLTQATFHLECPSPQALEGHQKEQVTQLKNLGKLSKLCIFCSMKQSVLLWCRYTHWPRCVLPPSGTFLGYIDPHKQCPLKPSLGGLSSERGKSKPGRVEGVLSYFWGSDKHPSSFRCQVFYQPTAWTGWKCPHQQRYVGDVLASKETA